MAGIQVSAEGCDGSGEFFGGGSMKSLFAVLILATAGLHSDPAFAQKSSKLRADRIKLNTCRPRIRIMNRYFGS